MHTSIGVKYGLIGSAVVAVYFLALYMANPEYFLSPLLQWGSLGFYLVFMWMAARADGALHGLSRDFRNMLRTPFVVFLLINLSYWVFYYALHLYDPGLVQSELMLELNGLKAQIEAGVGDPEQANTLRERIILLEKSIANPQPQPLGPIFTRMCIGALGGFGLSAGITAILRSSRA